MARQDEESYQRAVAAWAKERGWRCWIDAKDPDWTVKGARDRRAFTLTYSGLFDFTSTRITGPGQMNVVIHLFTQYPVAYVMMRSACPTPGSVRMGATSTTGMSG